MSPTKITCPRCRGTLKLPATIPAGFKPRCPRCCEPIALQGGAIAVFPPAMGILVSTAAATPVVAMTASPSRGAPDADAMAATQPARRGAHPLKTLAIIAVGVMFILLLTVGLLAICLVGDSTPPAVPDNPSVSERPAPTDKKAAPKALIVLSAENEKSVAKATQRGVQFIKDKQIKDGPEKGSFLSSASSVPHGMDHVPSGLTALAGLALLECGVPTEDPAIQSAAEFIRQRMRKREISSHEIYDVSVSILFLSRLDDNKDRDLIRSLALRVVASQETSGGWKYPCPPLSAEQESDLLVMLKDFKNHARKGPRGSLGNLPVGVFGNPDEKDKNFYRSSGDNSCTQFALLALWTARRYDLPLDPVLKLVARRFQKSQLSGGSWPYDAATDSGSVTETPTMTAAGLLGLAVGYGVEGHGKGAADIANDHVLQAGFKRLARNIGQPGENKNAPPDMYFLWSLERVAVLYQLPQIDGKDWYHWGLEILVERQNANGSWLMPKNWGTSEIVDTCFALLFLQCANLTKDLSDKIRQLMAVMGQAPQKQ